MTPERWREVSRIYHDALACDRSRRDAFVREACAGDEGVRQEVESLLAQPASSENFLGQPAVAVAEALGNPATSMLTGRRLGAYEVLDLVGTGGMGEVYRARDTRLRRDVAVKVLPPLFAADPDRRARFEREARLLAALNHPHIGAIYGFEEAEGVHALVLELIEGETLAERIAARRDSGLGILESLAIARQIADGLDTAHEKGI